MPLGHGDRVRILCIPGNATTHQGYMCNEYGFLCMDDTYRNREHALVWRIGNIEKKGKALRVHEGFSAITDDGKLGVIPEENPIGKLLRLCDIHSRVGEKRPLWKCFHSDLPEGSILQTGMWYFLQFDDEYQFWGTRPNLFFLDREPQFGVFFQFELHEDNIGTLPVQILDAPQHPVIACDPYGPLISIPTSTLDSDHTNNGQTSDNPGTMVVTTNPPQQIPSHHPQWWYDIPLPTCIHLTIDDSCSVYTDALVDYLNAQQIHCTMFLNGSQCQKHWQSLLKIVQSPYITAGIHTWDHQSMRTMPYEESRQQIVRTMQLVSSAHAIVGKVWPQSPRLFRFPFTDAGQRPVQFARLQSMLRELGFQAHRGMQQSLHYHDGIDIPGPFLNDGAYENSTFDEYMIHVRDRMQMFQREWPAMWNNMVLGTHDLRHEVRFLQFLVARGVIFLNPTQTQ